MFQIALRCRAGRACRTGWVFGLVLLCACEKKPPAQGSGAAASASALPAGLSAELASQVLAKVGDRTITLGEYAAVLQRMDQFERLRYQSAERRRLLLDEMIRVELLAAEARRRGLDKDPRTVERLRQVLRDELLVRVRAGLPGPEDIPEGEVRAYYEQHQDEFLEPERRRVAAIVLDGEAQARQVLAQATQASAAEWGRLVRQHSPYSAAPASASQPLELAGDLGIVSLGQSGRDSASRVPEPVRKAVFEIDRIGGVYGQVVPAAGKFYIVRLVGKTEARVRSFADAQRSIRVTLVGQRVRDAEDQLQAELRQRYPIRVDDAALALVRVPGANKGGAGSGSSQSDR
jgi:peptidyl-prolyl cis-trans isomerase C